MEKAISYSKLCMGGVVVRILRFHAWGPWLYMFRFLIIRFLDVSHGGSASFAYLCACHVLVCLIYCSICKKSSFISKSLPICNSSSVGWL